MWTFLQGLDRFECADNSVSWALELFLEEEPDSLRINCLLSDSVSILKAKIYKNIGIEALNVKTLRQIIKVSASLLYARTMI